MGNTSRTYSDPAYGSKKVIKSIDAGYAINGTNAADTTLARVFGVAQERTRLTGLRAANTTIGTALISNKIVLNTHSAGTGAAVGVGTVTIGTAGQVLTAGQTYTGTVTDTYISAGDALSLTLVAGTETTANAKIQVYVEITEAFLVTEENG